MCIQQALRMDDEAVCSRCFFFWISRTAARMCRFHFTCYQHHKLLFGHITSNSHSDMRFSQCIHATCTCMYTYTLTWKVSQSSPPLLFRSLNMSKDLRTMRRLTTLQHRKKINTQHTKTMDTRPLHQNTLPYEWQRKTSILPASFNYIILPTTWRW